MNDIWSLDLETTSLDDSNPQFALEPYRLVQSRARITELSVSGPDAYGKVISDPSTKEVIEILSFLNGKTVYAHNALFDISWLFALVQDIQLLVSVNWRDTMLLAKWILNSQAELYKTKESREETGGYDLASIVKRFLPEDTPDLQKFLDMKSEAHVAGEDREYWKERALLDTNFTRLLAIILQDKLPIEQRNGFLISQKQIPYVARAWVQGIEFDYDKIQQLNSKIPAAKVILADKIGVHPSVIQSPSQLSDLLFKDWGLSPLHVGKTGRGSTAKDDLKMIASQAQGSSLQEKMNLIMQFKKIQTLQTKYLNGFDRVFDYVGETKCHGAPRIFGTYTGRYTYASKTQRKQVQQNSIAMHQLPREGPAKACMLPTEGRMITELDAAGQEIAFMAWASGDTNMLSVLNQGMNVHSWMATNINGEDYDTFVDKVHKGDKNAYNTRQAAKLLNLSCQYRIGWAAIQAKFFGTYGIVIDRQKSNQYLGIYKATYPGVVSYWKDTCIEAQNKGYAETIAGRRYYLTDWKNHRWGTESSAINTPVQGSGADQKDLMIWLISEKFPEAIFELDCHDGLFFNTPINNELAIEMREFANSVDYSYWWNREIPMPLTFDVATGPNYKDKKEL